MSFRQASKASSGSSSSCVANQLGSGLRISGLGLKRIMENHQVTHQETAYRDLIMHCFISYANRSVKAEAGSAATPTDLSKLRHKFEA